MIGIEPLQLAGIAQLCGWMRETLYLLVEIRFQEIFLRAGSDGSRQFSVEAGGLAQKLLHEVQFV